DPKTTCVMGGAVWLFAEKLNCLDGMNLVTDNSLIRQRECFIGTFARETMNIEQCLFPTPGSVQAQLQVSKSSMLGIRRIDSEVCMVNPLWELVLDSDSLKGAGPYVVKLKQDNNNRECLTVAELLDAKGVKCNQKSAQLRLRTMVSDQYWLDTGCFDL
ncbi:MAG TPA: virulence factor SrfB, partial [Candidatus Rifleibacterium sp.]|nr:virulence factor SrfB [Candidatus Rifleibacterium sp.]